MADKDNVREPVQINLKKYKKEEKKREIPE